MTSLTSIHLSRLIGGQDALNMYLIKLIFQPVTCKKPESGILSDWS